MPKPGFKKRQRLRRIRQVRDANIDAWVIPFGRYKGLTMAQLWEKPEAGRYAAWVIKNFEEGTAWQKKFRNYRDLQRARSRGQV